MSELPLDDPSFYEDFLVEAGEHFELIEQNFLQLEENPGDLEVLNAIFRSVHTIKGASGFLGLPKVQALSHIGENVLDSLRKGRMSVTPEVMEVLFETADMLKVLVEDVGVTIRKQGTPKDPDTTDLISRLEAMKSGGAAPVPAKAGSPAPPVSKSAGRPQVDLPPAFRDADSAMLEAIAKAQAEGGPLLLAKAHFDPAILQSAFQPASLIPTVELVGSLLHASSPMVEQPLLEDFDHGKIYFEFLLLIRPSESLEAVEKLLGGFKNVEFTYHDFQTPATPAPEPPEPEETAPLAAATGPGLQARTEMATRKGPEKASEKGAGDTIRVSQAKLETFMNTVAELIISKTMINHLVEKLGAESRGTAVDDLVKELNRASAHLDQVSKEIQASVLGIRMVPVKTIFSKFPRMIRDLAKASGKKIDLQVFGEDTEIDKSLIEELGDPLIHLIRNSADHGIEMPEARIAAGKPETGRVALRARHEGDHVIVEIEDDGKGIDAALVRAKALEKGLITPERAESMSDEEAVELIFLPGFSLAQKVTDISGRGVGMDVVRSNVRRLNGNVSIRSTVGKGSVFTIKLPLTLAIIDALLMRSGGQVFALPGTSVEETLLVPLAQVASLTSRKAIDLRGEVLGVSSLNQLLDFSSKGNGGAEGSDLPIVVISSAGRRMGLIVDAFLRRQEMVIKPLAPYLASLPGISGASILGDGGVVLILDPSELMALATEAVP
jgi:two-component system chemotaxis sensor kinase CheA